MVSKARDDLPLPDRPVSTTILSRGMATSMFFRLFSRAPLIKISFAIVVSLHCHVCRPGADKGHEGIGVCFHLGADFAGADVNGIK